MLFEEPNFIEGAGPAGPCWICGQPTTTIDVNFMAYEHPNCERVAWAQFDAANLAIEIANSDGVLILL